jgi:simple sugar transport system permease protein
MQLAGVSGDVLTIVQASIVLFIAAPPLVRAIFRLPKVSDKGRTDSADENRKERAKD